jgi:MYXO-CTERM domain-containing protein
VLFGSYRRTSVGLSKNHAKLYLFSSNNTMTGAELAQAVLAHAAEGGAPEVDVASNEDGGGSSQLYVAGLGQIITSGRLVANHLGVQASGSGDAPNCPSRPPTGYLDGADCDFVRGWTQDPDVPTQSIGVLVAFDGMYPDPKARYTNGIADVDRPDVGKVVGSNNHGFEVPTPYGLFDGKDHPILVVGQDAEDLRSGLLSGTKTVTCTAKPPPSLKRHIVNQETYAAWKLSAFDDQLALADGVLDAIPEAAAIDTPPELVQADDGTPEVWLVDGTTRRHVTSGASARAWHFDLGTVKKTKAATVYALTLGPPLRFRPMLAKGTGPAIWLLDAKPEEKEDAGTSSDAGGNGEVPGGDAGCSCSSVPSAPRAGDALLVIAFALVRRRRGPSSVRRALLHRVRRLRTRSARSRR